MYGRCLLEARPGWFIMWPLGVGEGEQNRECPHEHFRYSGRWVDRYQIGISDSVLLPLAIRTLLSMSMSMLVSVMCFSLASCISLGQYPYTLLRYINVNWVKPGLLWQPYLGTWAVDIGWVTPCLMWLAAPSGHEQLILWWLGGRPWLVSNGGHL